MTPLQTDLQHLIDRAAAKTNTHGILLGVQSGDEQVHFLGSAGDAQVHHRFFIASITKMFTAAVILQLVDEGRLNLDTSAQSLLPDYDLTDLHTVKGIRYGAQVTVRHLLHQTSGLADYYQGPFERSLMRNEDQSYGLDDVLRMAKALPPKSAPNDRRSFYSDTNFQLLGTIIEAATQQPLQDVFKARIFDPLGLSQTELQNANAIKKEPRLLSIHHKDQALTIPLALSSMGPDGGVVSTLEELLIFLRAHRAYRLFERKHEAQLHDWNPLFFPFQYGLGLMRFKLPRWMNLFRETPELIGHPGASGSFAFHAPRSDMFLVGTFNQTDAPKRPFGFMMQVLKIIEKHRETI